MTAEALSNLLAELSDEGPVVLEGFDSCVIGTAERFGLGGRVLAYDYEACVELLMVRDGMDRDGAIEYLDFNVLGAWFGEGTPVFVTLS